MNPTKTVISAYRIGFLCINLLRFILKIVILIPTIWIYQLTPYPAYAGI